MILDIPVKCGKCGRPLTGVSVEGVFIIESCRVCIETASGRVKAKIINHIKVWIEKGGDN